MFSSFWVVHTFDIARIQVGIFETEKSRLVVKKEMLFSYQMSHLQEVLQLVHALVRLLSQRVTINKKNLLEGKNFKPLLQIRKVKTLTHCNPVSANLFASKIINVKLSLKIY